MSWKDTSTNVAVIRLSVYNRMLEELSREGRKVVSSSELGEKTGYTAAQIRKDLSHFGEFGQVGLGYYVTELKEAVSRILGTNRTWNVALVGAGNLGSALLTYPGFQQSGFQIVAVFDNDFRKIGKKWENVVLQDISRMPEIARERDIQIGMIAVPAGEAQRVANIFVSSDISAIMNFAPVSIAVPQGVKVCNVDVSRELERLTYYLKKEAEDRIKVFEQRQEKSREKEKISESYHYR